MRDGLLGAGSEDDEAEVRAAQDALDLGQLLAACPSIDGLAEVLARRAVPSSEAGDEEAERRWGAFAALARTIRERRREACED